MDLNSSSKADHQAVDSTLRAVHDELVRKRAGDARFLKDLDASDRAWVAFVDAETELHYPSPYIDGSFEYVCVLLFRTKMMEARVNTLRALLLATGPGGRP